MAGAAAPKEPIYRLILWLAGALMAVGVALMAGAEELAPRVQGLANVGAGLALAAAVVLLAVRWLARRARK